MLSHSSFIGLLLAVGQLAIMARDNAITQSRSRERRSARLCAMCSSEPDRAFRVFTRAKVGLRSHRATFERALLLQVFYGIRSERQLMEQLDYNLLYRWFVGLSPDDPVWDVLSFCCEATAMTARRPPAALDCRRNRRLLCRDGQHRTKAGVCLFRGGARPPIGRQASHQRRGAADRGYRQAA